MRSLLLTLIIVLLAGCTTPRDDYDMTEFMADYCDSAGPGRTTPNTNVTVDFWDDESTTAGHRGTLTDDRMEPDVNQTPPRGC